MTSGTRPRRQMHEVQAVVGPKPEIRDEQVGWLVEQAGAGVPKVGACLDVGHEPQGVLHRAQPVGIRIDQEDLFGFSGDAGRPRHEIGIEIGIMRLDCLATAWPVISRTRTRAVRSAEASGSMVSISRRSKKALAGLWARSLPRRRTSIDASHSRYRRSLVLHRATIPYEAGPGCVGSRNTPWC